MEKKKEIKSKKEWQNDILKLYNKKIDKKCKCRSRCCSKKELNVEHKSCLDSTREKIEKIWLKLRNWSRNCSGPQC